jgi:hypothetical protein
MEKAMKDKSENFTKKKDENVPLLNQIACLPCLSKGTPRTLKFPLTIRYFEAVSHDFNSEEKKN